MKKNKLFIILAILTISLLLTMAAICNTCQLQLTPTEDEKTTVADNQDSGETAAKTKSSDKKEDSKSEGKKDSQGSTAGKNIEIKDIVIGTINDSHVEPETVLYTDSHYACYPVFTIKADGTESYDWSVSGGSNDDSMYYMQWDTPSDTGFYTITVNVTKNDGSSGKFTKNVVLDPLPVVGEPPEPPTITQIEISGSDDGNYYTNRAYRFNIATDGPFDMIDRYDIQVSSGTVLSLMGGIMEWQSPDMPGTVTITATIFDSSGNILDSKELVLTIGL